MSIDVERVWDALHTVIDPELGVNVADLGLIYNVDVNDEEASVDVDMTMTTPACPLSAYLEQEVTSKVQMYVPAVEVVKVHLVWQPPWQPAMMSTAARKQLGWSV